MTNSNAAIFNMLPAARRRALEDEAAAQVLRDILRKHQRGTFAKLVEGLAKSKHWSAISRTKVSSVLTPASRGRGRPRTAWKPTDEQIVTVLAVVKKHPGLRTEEIRKKTELGSMIVRGALAHARKKKLVRTSGSRRVMKYRLA